MGFNWGRNIWIDCSDVVSCLNKFGGRITEGNAHEAMLRAFMDAGRKVKTIMAEDIPPDYCVGGGWVAGQVGQPKPGGGVGEVSVTVPVKGPKGKIGSVFGAVGGYHKHIKATTVHMADGTVRSRKAYWRNARAQAHIVTAGISTLPNPMRPYSANPAFVYGGAAYTRKGKSRFPIVNIVALSVAQMPVNRSEDAVVADIKSVTYERVMHYISLLLG